MSRLSVVGKLAEGSAVDLFLGKDGSSGSRVVIEALRTDVALPPDLMSKLLTEAKLRQTLDHPNLARRIRVSTSSQGRQFWVSEPVKGDTLRKLLAGSGRLSPSDAVRLVTTLSLALFHLHQRGFTHGAVTPDYVLVEGNNKDPKLVDSGLSLFRLPSLGSAQPRTLVHAAYLSPERVQGQRASEHSDIYALGILLYELLTGSTPYSDKDPTTTRLKHLSAPLPRLPSGLELLEPVLHGCLAKTIEGRFDSGQSLHHALVRAQQQLELKSRKPAPATPVAPADFGSYRVVRPLGEGATGLVSLGRHVQIDREVAIKVLRQEHAQNREIVARFFQEAKAANKAHHENIAEIYDMVDECALGSGTRCYLVMEYVRGLTLGQAIKKESLSISRAAKIARQVCAALSAAHKVGVIHRDIKPDNIFLTERGGTKDYVKLVDFGIAKLCWDANSDAPALTSNGELLGTPSYMAPEQLSARHVDGRADIYAVGTVLYQMLSGKKPFTGQTLGEVLVKLTKTPPPYLGDVTAGGEALPLDLRRIVMRCLEKDPAARIQTMDELRDLLRPFEDGTYATPAGLQELSKAVATAFHLPTATGKGAQGDGFDGLANDPVALVDPMQPVTAVQAAPSPRPAEPGRRTGPPRSLERPRPAKALVPGETTQTLLYTGVQSAPRLPPPAGGRSAVVPSPAPTLEVRYLSRRSALSASMAEGSKVILFVTASTMAPIGTRLELKISFGDSPRVFQVTGTIISHAPALQARRAGGFSIAFEGSEKRAAAEMLAFCAARPRSMGTAGSRRIDVTIPCKVKASHSKYEGKVADLSRTGAFVEATDMRALKVGMSLRLQLEPGWLGLGRPWLEATLVWRGQKEGRPGFGVRFGGSLQEQNEVLGPYLRSPT